MCLKIKLILLIICALTFTNCAKEPKGSKGKPNKKPPRKDTKKPGTCSTRCMAGLPGPLGRQGPVGRPGPDGIQGVQGVPGVQGVQGPTGDTGLRGYKGDTGQKGRRGFKGRKGDTVIPRPPPRHRRRHVAFSVTMDDNVPAVKTELNRVLRYNVILTNVGHSYDAASGYFTAPVNGTYMFGFSGVSYDGQNVLLHLVRNGERLLSAYDNSGCLCCEKPANAYYNGGGKCAGSGGNAGILSLAEGDNVCIELADEYGLHNALYHSYASFYGHLLFSSKEIEYADP